MSDQPVTVVNLATREVLTYTCSPEEAVVAAYAQEHHDFNTWDYDARYGKLVEHGQHTVLCGNWSAYFCSCHPHQFNPGF
jgi:hypothetical protein